MVTNSVAEHRELAGAGTAHGANGIGARLLEKVQQLVCGLHGHDNLLQFERDRMCLRCVSCGHETPGWEITETPPVVARDQARPSVVRPHLISERRIA